MKNFPLLFRLTSSFRAVSATVFFLLCAAPSFGQTVGINGEIRSRSEYRDGFRKPLADDLSSSLVSLLRTRVIFDYGHEKIQAKIALMDARVYGQTNSNDTRNALGIDEAWGSYAFTPELSVVIGRQGVGYDDTRLLTATSAWSNVGDTHDLFLLKYESPDLFTLHLGAAWNNNGDNIHDAIYTVAKHYKTLTYLWFGKSFGILNFSAIWLNDSFNYGELDTEADKKAFRNTMGGNLALNRKELPVSFLATAYYQFGHDPKNNPLNTCFLSLNGEYKFTPTWALKAGVDYFAAGFNKLYGSNHAFNGSMEYWVNLPAEGLCDLYGGPIFRPFPKFDVSATFHAFSLTKTLPGGNEKNLGTELDIKANYIVSPQLALQGGWSGYFKTNLTDQMKDQTGVDARFPQWAYVMLTFTPQFLNK